MDMICSSETSVAFQLTILRYIPEASTLRNVLFQSAFLILVEVNLRQSRYVESIVWNVGMSDELERI
jgi:hypothetical protein